MNARRGSLYLGVLAWSVLAAGCQNEGIDTPIDVAENDPRVDQAETSRNDSAAETTKDNDGDSALSRVVSCAGQTDSFEPNDRLSRAVEAPLGKTRVALCSGDEDWFRVVVPAHTIVRAGIEMNLSAGDLDLVVYDAQGEIVGGRYGNQYPSSWRGFETDKEFYGLYSEKGNAVYYLRVVGHAGAQNAYTLHVDHLPYMDGENCTATGFSFAECLGQGSNGSGLLPFPFADEHDSVAGGSYIFESLANYRFARRELIMLVRHALAETQRAFPNTTPLSLIDICQQDGITPGYDVNDPRHPQSTHDQGGNIDISYFQTDGSNDAEIVCGDGSTHADGYCSKAATSKNFVDFPRQAFFMAKLFASSRTRVVGTDTVLAPLIADAARVLAALPVGNPQRITQSELAGFTSRMAFGSGWPYHHHHIHLSMQWWPKAGQFVNERAFEAPAAVHSMEMPELASSDSAH